MIINISIIYYIIFFILLLLLLNYIILITTNIFVAKVHKSSLKIFFYRIKILLILLKCFETLKQIYLPIRNIFEKYIFKSFMKILMLFFSSNLNYTLLNLIQKLDSRKFISCWNEWKIANFYTDAGKETRFYNVQDIKRGRWRVFPWCRRRETREELWIRNLLSRETKFAPYETNSNLYRERFAEQTKLPTIYIYISTYIRRGIVDARMPKPSPCLIFLPIFQIASRSYIWFSRLNRCSDDSFEYKRLNILFINFI